MIVISQPTYLPWIGYFALIDVSKRFVFLDDVQFDRRSWQQRNRILNNKTINYLTIPVKKRGLRNQYINEVKINDNNIFNKHIIKIYHAYSKTKFFKDYFPKIEKILQECSKKDNLCEANILIIKALSQIIGIDSKFVFSSELKSKGKKSDKLISICNKLDQKNYIINEGALDYILNDKSKFQDNNINLFYLKMNIVPYKQLNDKFVDLLSIIDLLFNEGPNTSKIIRNCYKVEKI